mmetsp:Transcript_32098/g.75349  ORF Transcript_32098/g.75349 Transcript_32098/m.75349 type:complete len:339 (+) Transcript_32098:348-1364(+)
MTWWTTKEVIDAALPATQAKYALISQSAPRKPNLPLRGTSSTLMRRILHRLLVKLDLVVAHSNCLCGRHGRSGDSPPAPIRAGVIAILPQGRRDRSPMIIAPPPPRSYAGGEASCSITILQHAPSAILSALERLRLPQKVSSANSCRVLHVFLCNSEDLLREMSPSCSGGFGCCTWDLLESLATAASGSWRQRLGHDFREVSSSWPDFIDLNVASVLPEVAPLWVGVLLKASRRYLMTVSSHRQIMNARTPGRRSAASAVPNCCSEVTTKTKWTLPRLQCLCEVTTLCKPVPLMLLFASRALHKVTFEDAIPVPSTPRTAITRDRFHASALKRCQLLR